MISFSFFSVKNIWRSKSILWNTNEEIIILLNHVRLMCHALRSKFFYLNLSGLQNLMTKTLRIWRSGTIGVIVSFHLVKYLPWILVWIKVIELCYYFLVWVFGFWHWPKFLNLTMWKPQRQGGATWSSPNITDVTRPCPSGITNLDGDGEKVDCHYLLTTPSDQFDSNPQLFK